MHKTVSYLSDFTKLTLAHLTLFRTQLHFNTERVGTALETGGVGFVGTRGGAWYTRVNRASAVASEQTIYTKIAPPRSGEARSDDLCSGTMSSLMFTSV